MNSMTYGLCGGSQSVQETDVFIWVNLQHAAQGSSADALRSYRSALLSPTDNDNCDFLFSVLRPLQGQRSQDFPKEH